MIVIDQSFLQKSGRCTLGEGLYWSGVAGTVRQGLEINAICVSNVEKYDCMILTALLTPSPDVLKEQSVNLRSWYLTTTGASKETLREVSGRVMADAYFATRDFVNGLKEMGFDTISPDPVTIYVSDMSIGQTRTSRCAEARKRKSTAR